MRAISHRKSVAEGGRIRTLIDKLWSAVGMPASTWCRKRQAWKARAALLLYLVYAGVRTWFDDSYGSLFSGLTFALHETGHLLFGWFGLWIGIAGGTGLQVLAPIGAGIHLQCTQGDYFGSTVCGCWLGFACQDAAIYIGDAQAQQLPLVGFSSHPIHDWHYLLDSVGLLKLDWALAAVALGIGIVFWASSCAAGGWLCWRIFESRRHGSEGA